MPGDAFPTVTVLDHGPPDRRFDVVVLADGFGAHELDAFAEAVRAFVAELLATEPFGLLRALVNVHRVDAVGPGTSVLDGRLVTVDEDAALRLARRHVPDADAVLVLANREEYGGSAGSVACLTRHPWAAALAVHELGHAAFDLADEYGHEGRHPGPEPSRLNVTLERDPARAPWAGLAGTGCVEGGDRYASGVYRAQATCRMRTLGEPFCVVCAREIRRVLLLHARGEGRTAYTDISPSPKRVVGDRFDEA
ncbi:M64 family metallopeptidase [Cellulomonas sp. ICMP 17802]|uniref:M64 family metallopeptidase n=1 Tax=Cellulomonas sp. ICMP 17802 TaxID=3239199 RepID=UPI00351B78AE